MNKLKDLLKILNTNKMVLQCYEHMDGSWKHYPANIRVLYIGCQDAYVSFEKDERYEQHKNAQLDSICILDDGTVVVQLDYFRTEEDSRDVEKGIDYAKEYKHIYK